MALQGLVITPTLDEDERARLLGVFVEAVFETSGLLTSRLRAHRSRVDERRPIRRSTLDEGRQEQHRAKL